MTKKQKKEIKYSEADLIDFFQLNRLVGNDGSALMKKWTTIKKPIFEQYEEVFLDIIWNEAKNGIEGWNEEELKTKFICFVIRLGLLNDNHLYKTYAERELFEVIDGYYLYAKPDFMIAKGILDKPKTPYFYFQEYKKMKDPSGDPVPQLLEGFLIAQAHNQNKKPLYGCTITGKLWDFFVMENKNYCISKSYDCTDKEDLWQIIALLRNFKHILETQLID